MPKRKLALPLENMVCETCCYEEYENTYDPCRDCRQLTFREFSNWEPARWNDPRFDNFK